MILPTPCERIGATTRCGASDLAGLDGARRRRFAVPASPGSPGPQAATDAQ